MCLLITNCFLRMCDHSGLCKLTMKADKRATVQSTVVTKTSSSLISCSTIHDLPVLHTWKCDAVTWSAVKRLANQNRIYYFFDMIGQSDMLSLYGTEIRICLGHRELSGTKKTRRRLVQAVVPKVLQLVFCQTSWHNLKGLSTLPNQRFPESKFSNERTGAVPRLDLGLQRPLHPSWARKSAGCMRGEVSSSVFVTLGCRQL